MIIKNTGVSVSRFVFGTASLFNVGNKKKRLDLLSAAVDAGFTHFDTAPYYGFGFAERDLAPVLKAHPHVTVTTKVGIYSPGGESQPAPAVFLRKAAGRFIKAISRPLIDFSVARARTTLEASLRRMGREVIDIYTLHEPETALVFADEWRRWMEDCVATGKVRTFGAALTADRLIAFTNSKIDLGPFVQVADSLDAKEADILAAHGKPMQITYGYVSAAFRSGEVISVADILKQALKRNLEGAIIVSSTKVSRLGQYSRILEDADRDQ
ncbi:aldo/keto reductase [Rhizobium straminoryzae]|uniref:aldo/keto reductase n=1 Tax=Rhizobium straminoryzae TaxID=1387186 RepID=UPI001FE54EE3|nr:aldo/keto reductase [Rhizobium straminoryzae]